MQNIHNNEDTSLGKEIGHVSHDNYHCFLWPTQKLIILCQLFMISMFRMDLNIREDSVKLFRFASDRVTENLQSFYIGNIELLKEFKTSFNSNAAEIISLKDESLAIYKDFKSPRIYIDRYNTKNKRIHKGCPDSQTSYVDNKDIGNFYLNYIGLLKRFIICFRFEAKGIIADTARNLMTILNYKINFDNHKRSVLLTELRSFKQLILPGKIIINKYQARKITLTSKGTEYLILMLAGKSMKKIAEELGKSPKKIESLL